MRKPTVQYHGPDDTKKVPTATLRQLIEQTSEHYRNRMLDLLRGVSSRLDEQARWLADLDERITRVEAKQNPPSRARYEKGKRVVKGGAS